MTIMFSVEICVRLYKAKKRVQDPDLDNLINPHEVKHWMDPRIIPYGWGLFRQDLEEETGMGMAQILELLSKYFHTAVSSVRVNLRQPCDGGNQNVLIISPSDLDTVIDIQDAATIRDGRRRNMETQRAKENVKF